ncbi:MAG: hypothetical protein HYY24_07415 [Verrucomicrobia bacterium]|nr:hypothetical protein [Verrucomicrobiota bacterium]
MIDPQEHLPAACTRRVFLKTSTAAIAGLSVAGRVAADAKAETLAVSGGAKAVTFRDDKHATLCRWPRYGAAEKQRLHELIESNQFYEDVPELIEQYAAAFEKVWAHRTEVAKLAWP